MDTTELKLDLNLLLEHTRDRGHYLPLSVLRNRLQAAVVEGTSGLGSSLLKDLHTKYRGVDLKPVSRAVYEKALWNYFGEHRPHEIPIDPPKPHARTFRVAEVKPAENPLPERALWEHCREQFTEVRGVSQFYSRIIEHPEPVTNHVILAAYLAFAQHRPLILSPDAIWLTLLQGLSEHLELNAEELRSLWVNHQGQKRLLVPAPQITLESLESPWEEVFADFRHQIQAHLLPEAAELANIRFSTTGPLEQAVFSVALMDVLKVYFKYELTTICGIPEITLEGTPSDWSMLRQAVRPWSRYGLDWWLDSLDPVLAQFEAAAAGQVDLKFWRDLYQHHDPIHQEYGGPLQTLSGWIARLYPYHAGQPNPALREISPLPIAGFRSSLSRASVRAKTLGGEGDLEFVAGVLGVEQRGIALRPCLGWVVHQKHSRYIEDDRERAIKQLRPELRSQVAPPPSKLSTSPLNLDSREFRPMAEPLTINLGRSLLDLIRPELGAPLAVRVRQVREHLSGQLGLLIPGIRFRDQLLLRPKQYEIRVFDRLVGTFDLEPGCLLAVGPEARLQELPEATSSISWSREPVYQMNGVWTRDRGQAEAKGLLLFDPVCIIANHLTDQCRANAGELLCYQSWCALRDTQRKTHPHLHKAVRGQGIRSTRIWRVLQELLQEQVPIRNLVAILQTLMLEPTRELPGQVEACRRALAGQFIEERLAHPQTLEVVRLDEQQEQTLRQSQPEELYALTNHLVELVQASTNGGWGVHFVTAADCRRRLRDLLKPSLPRAAYFSLEELPPDLRLVPLSL